jgi:hypothetical protein
VNPYPTNRLARVCNHRLGDGRSYYEADPEPLDPDTPPETTLRALELSLSVSDIASEATRIECCRTSDGAERHGDGQNDDR